MISRLKALLMIAANRRGQRDIVLRQTIFRLASRVTPVLAVDVRGVRYFLDTTDQDLARAIFVHGTYEQSLMQRAVQEIIRLSGPGKGLKDRVFVDVGANVGTATLAALCHLGASAAVTFEPHPSNFKLLQHNLLANSLVDRVVAHQSALSDREARLELEVFPSHQGSHRVRTRSGMTVPAHSTLNPAGVIQVNATTFDAAIDASGMDLDGVGLVWIDTEGHEGHVLAGAERLLKAEIPVVIEFWPAALRAAGGLERLGSLVTCHYTHILDLSQNHSRVLPATEFPLLIDQYDTPSGWTDLLLLKL